MNNVLVNHWPML